MSRKHPIIAVTGSSGAGTSTVKNALSHIFHRVGATAAVVEGDSFHRYDRREMRAAEAEAQAGGRVLSHFGPEANLFHRQQELFEQYGATKEFEKLAKEVLPTTEGFFFGNYEYAEEYMTDIESTIKQLKYISKDEEYYYQSSW